jgi:translation initiation factor 2-alpha kinase 4
MQYCKRTLADVLAEGPMPEERIWRTLRQLAAGLQHIHAQGIIHRDIKPGNIFMDFGDNVKLGDFGLATESAPRAADAKPDATVADGDGGSGSANGGDGGGDSGVGGGGGGGGGGAASEAVHMHLEASVTADAGTYFYMDPYTTGGKATAALDIWSLGVVLLELCEFFATGMERAEALHGVRNGRGVSAEFASRQPTQAQLITQMLHASPAKRPSARAILESPLLPPRLEDELIKDALRVLSKPHSVYFLQIALI